MHCSSDLPSCSRFRDRCRHQKCTAADGLNSACKMPAAIARIDRARACRIELGKCARIRTALCRQGTAVTVIDFTAFIGRLATASGETILPFFRTSLSIDNKSAKPRFRSGHRGRPRRRSGDAAADQGQLSPARHRRRGIRQRARGRRICLGARSDRRHQILHRGLSDLGHADRAAAQGHAGVRHDAPALYRRALFRRQRLGALFRAVGRTETGGAALRLAEGSDLLHHQSAVDERRRPRRLRPGRGRRCG